jgi:hypothetical protein
MKAALNLLLLAGLMGALAGCQPAEKGAVTMKTDDKSFCTHRL